VSATTQGTPPPPPVSTSTFSVLAYYPTWDVGLGYTPQDVDFSIVTHAIQFSMIPTSTSPYFIPRASDEGNAYINPKTGQVVQSVQRGLIDESHLYGKKTLLGIADVAFFGTAHALGWIIADPVRTDTFVNAVVNYLKVKGYDGVDINWEYPGAADRDNFTIFLSKLRTALDTMVPRGVLTITVDLAQYNTAQRGVDPLATSPYVDFFISESIPKVVGVGNGSTDVPNALYHPACTPFDAHTYMDATSNGEQAYVTVNGWAQLGVPRSKLSMYMATYFERYTGTDGPCQSYIGVANQTYLPMTLGQVLRDYSTKPLVVDSVANAKYFAWTDANGKQTVTYWDEQTAADFIHFLRSRGFSSVALYELGTAYVNKTYMPTFTKPRDYLLKAVGAAASDVMPPPVSTLFAIGGNVRTTASLNVRGAPTSLGTLLGTQAAGVLGSVMGGPIAADGYIWWHINYNTGVDGWSAENWLSLVP
ncbi:MAG: glycoside hydrolase family 18 protein, partial [Patescibacteria group bacterium]